MPFSSFFLRHRAPCNSRPLRFIHKSDLTFIHVPDATPPYISYPRVTDSNFRQATGVSEKLEFGTCSAPSIENVIEDFDETNAMYALLRSKMENARTGIRRSRNMLNRAPTPLRSLQHFIYVKLNLLNVINFDAKSIQII